MKSDGENPWKITPHIKRCGCKQFVPECAKIDSFPSPRILIPCNDPRCTATIRINLRELVRLVEVKHGK